LHTPPMVASANDVELLRLTSEGNEAAYDELVSRHRSAVHAFATELANEQATADDLTDAGFDALRERAGEAELIGAVRPFLLMTAADLSGADFDLNAECRGWDPLDAASQAVLWHVDIEGDPVETVALVSGVPVDEVPAVVEAARTAVGVPNGGDAALRARLTAYLLGPTASALAAAHAPAPPSTPTSTPTFAPAAAPIAGAPEATDEAEVAAQPEPGAEPPVAEDDPTAELDDDATGEVPAIDEPIVAEMPAEIEDAPAAEVEPEVEVESSPVAEVDEQATGEVPVIDEPVTAEAPVDEPEETADETREVPVVAAEAAPPAAFIVPPPDLIKPPAAEQPVRAVPAEHAAFARPVPPPSLPAEPAVEAMEPVTADSGPGVTPYAALDNEDTGPVPVIRPAQPVTYGSRTLTTVLAPVTAVAVVLLAVSLAGAAVLRDEPEAEFQPSNQGSTTSKVERNRPQETVPGQVLRKKKHKKKPSESPSASESESPSESPSGSPSDPQSGLPSPSNGTSPDPTSGPPSPTGPTNTTPPEPTNTSGPTGSPSPTDTGTPTATPTSTPTNP
jgi:hypothetical protein